VRKILPALFSALILSFGGGVSGHSDDAPSKWMSHQVLFALKDNSAEAKKAFVASCKKYLSKHPGAVFYAAGERAEEIKSAVNDKEFDIALNLVFKDEAAFAKYRDSEVHKKFVTENINNFAKVRVFDAFVEQ
jgi:hypothetical protein